MRRDSKKNKSQTDKSSDIKKYYISNRTVHLGGIRKTVQKGTIITHVVTSDGNESIQIGGEKITNMSDFNICMKYKFFDQATQQQVDNGGQVQKEVSNVKVQQKTKMPIQKSDQDLMPQQIDISDTKNQYMKKEQKIRQSEQKNSSKDFKVLKQIEQKIDQGISMSVTTEKVDTGEDQIAREINGETKEVKKIGEEQKPVVSKRKPNEKAMARAAARKKQSQANQKKLQQEKSKKSKSKAKTE